jgi:hypothetical protein
LHTWAVYYGRIFLQPDLMLVGRSMGNTLHLSMSFVNLLDCFVLSQKNNVTFFFLFFLFGLH